MRQALAASILLALVIPSVSLAQSPFDDAGCTNTTTGHICPQLATVNVDVAYTDDVVCFSQGGPACTSYCADVIDAGCFGVVRTARDATYRACYATSSANGVNYNCQDSVLRAGTDMTVLIDPTIIDYSACSKVFDNGTYVITCPYRGRVQNVNASLAEGSVMVLSATDVPGVSLEAVMIIALVAAIAAVALWILRPPKAGRTAGVRRLHRRERRQ